MAFRADVSNRVPPPASFVGRVLTRHSVSPPCGLRRARECGGLKPALHGSRCRAGLDPPFKVRVCWAGLPPEPDGCPYLSRLSAGKPPPFRRTACPHAHPG